MNFGFFTYRQKLLVLVNKIFQFQTSPNLNYLIFSVKTILAVWLIIAFHDPYHTVERQRYHSCPEMRGYCSSPGSVLVIRNISTHLSPLQQLVAVAQMHRKSPARTDGWKEPCPSDRSWQPPSTCLAHVLLPSTQHPSWAWASRRFPSTLFPLGYLMLLYIWL